MKKLGLYTARGIVTEAETEAGEPHKISLFDGRFDTAYRVVEFHIWGASWGSSTTSDCIGKLSKNAIGVTGASQFMRADDDNQIAWAFFGATTDSASGGIPPTIIDPDNMVVEDLYVYARSNTGATANVNYMVVMEKYQITESEGALLMARDRADGE